MLAQSTLFACDLFDYSADVFREVALQPEFPTFLTLGAYSKYLVEAD